MRARHGFTLFEVLAAVAILGLVYTVLAGVAMRGLQAEGDTERRLLASLLADGALFELEAAIDAGVPPETGEAEVEQDLFRIRTEVTPFEGPLLEAALAPAGADEGRIAAPAPRRPGSSLLLPARAGGTAPLRRVDVVVTWVEGSVEHAVRRTTFAFDPAAAGDLLADLRPAAAPPAGGDGDGASASEREEGGAE